MRTYIITFQVIHGYAVTVAADDEEAATAEALAAYDRQALEADYVEFDDLDFCFQEAAP